jgi:electron transfer flavoprotein beta subunit
MKIAVCVSHVPDTTTKIMVGPDGKTIDKTGVTFIINPYDEFAVEEALRLKEKFSGEVTAIALGPESVKETLRKAFAMGVEKGIWIKESLEMDSNSTAQSLAAVLKNLSPDIILFGKQSVDYDSNQVGILIAELLDLPSISVVTKLEINGSDVTCEREIEGGKEIVQSRMPVVITCQKGLNEPRYPNLKGIMAAKTKPIATESGTGSSLTEILSMRKPSSKSGGRILGTDANAVPELIKLLHDEVKVF